MSRPRPPLLGVILLAGALACGQVEPADRDTTPSVVFQPSSTVGSTGTEPGQSLGPSGAAPEVIVLGDARPVEPAEPRTVRRPEPGPRVIYRTIYVEEPAPAQEPAPEPVAEEAAAPLPEPVVPEAEPDIPEPAQPSGPEPVATAPPTSTPPTFPSGGSSRTEDAIVGAAIGAGIGAILGGRDGAIAGGIGGAIGGAMGGRSGGILGGVLGGAGRGSDRCVPRRPRWAEPARGVGSSEPARGNQPGILVDDFVSIGGFVSH